jgi:hypothetical protein
MALPKKISRVTTVDGVKYRWTVTRQEYDQTAMLTFLAHEEQDAKAGRTSHAKLRVTWAESHCDSVSPAIAIGLIRGGIKQGWNPRGLVDHAIGPFAAVKLLSLI